MPNVVVKLAIAVLLLLTALNGAATGAEEYAILQEYTYIPLSDGTRIHASIWRPDAPGRFPAIVSYGPYGTGSTPNPELTKLVRRGYVSVSASIRGTGCSQGTMNIFSPQEARDGAEIVEWAGVQGWSTGNVGLQGQSYLAINQFLIAAQRPSHLRAIAPHAFLSDLYRDIAYPGGIYEYGMSALFSFAQHAQQAALGVGYGGGVEAAGGSVECFQNQQGRHENLQHFTTFWSISNPFDGPEYWSRSPLRFVDRIQVPVLMFASFQDDQVGSRGIDIFERLRVPKMMILTNGLHATPTSFFWNELFESVSIRWYDHWLKGIDTGLMEEAPVRVAYETTGANVPGFWRMFDSWPPAEATPKPFYLRGGGALRPDPPVPSEPADASYVHPNGIGTNAKTYWHAPRVGGLTYTSDPFDNDMLATGPAALTLFANSTATDTDFFVTVSDVDAEGRSAFVQKGLLRASHRAVDAERSQPMRPYHPHDTADPLIPGKTYQLEIEILPIGHVFRKGHRLRLDIHAPPLPPEPFWGYVTTPNPAVNRVVHTQSSPSALWLSVLPSAGPLPPAPACPARVGQPCRQVG